MADTYTQCYVHLVFAVKNRDSLIKIAWNEMIFRYAVPLVHIASHILQLSSVLCTSALWQLNFCKLLLT